MACKLLHGQNQRKALVHVAQKMQWKEDYTFSPVELAGELGLTRQAGWKMCRAFVKKGIFEDAGNLRLDVRPEIQKSPANKVYGFTYYLVHQYRANLSAVKALFGSSLPRKSLPTITYPHITQYSPNQVEGVLDRFLDKKGLRRTWSEKRGGWLIKCAGACEHTERKRSDETVLYTTRKSNGFLLISAKCRHESCGTALMEWCKQLNKEWGKYFNDCQYGATHKQKSGHSYSPFNTPPRSAAATPLDPTGECILSFMAKEQSETLLKQVEDMDAEMNLLRKQCWKESQYWKQYNDAKYRFTPDYWKYKKAWKPYYDLRDTRNTMLERLRELQACMENEI